MILKDIIRDANEILGLAIDWDNYAEDEHYKQLFRCACLVLDGLTGEYQWDSLDEITEMDTTTIIYGILCEYSFTAGMLNEWKVWREKFANKLFEIKQEESKNRKIPRAF